jgi:hypothetical protein
MKEILQFRLEILILLVVNHLEQKRIQTILIQIQHQIQEEIRILDKILIQEKTQIQA